ncbi:inositol monophosphatase family protein [Paracoccus mangrovi]|uniref:Inositol monophosphatase family protein n=1 Tax=Paracoccus mangrovi TaxID=1715645 RepID=A0ABV7R8S5_9RHOB
MTIDLNSRLATAEAIARQAGKLALDYFRKRDQLDIQTKRSLSDMVSEADRETETLIRAALSEAYPEDAQLGEEHGLSDGVSGLTWVIDPIDGTAPYLMGMPGWCVSIGLMDADGPLLGAIYAPVLDEMYLGLRGQGATLNGRPIRVTGRFTLETGLLGLGGNDKVPAARMGQLVGDLAGQGIAWTRYGSGALMLAFVAAGRLTGYVEARMSIWDCLAAYAIIRAAGGRTGPLPPAGAMLDSFPVLGAIPAAFDRLHELTRFDAPDWRL